MDNIETIVADHYTIGNLDKNIRAGLTATGVDLDKVTVEDLSVVDEFHIGGRAATDYIIEQMALTGHEHVLDVGSGIGGAARVIATRTGCRVSGIDLTPEYVSVAKSLTDLTCLNDKVDFQTASALDMPYDDASFDAAVTIHVAMNIKDRTGLYKEIARILKKGAKFCIYDVMKKGDEPLAFPVPWADTQVSSHLRTPDQVVTHLHDAGFEVGNVDDRTEFANAYFARRIAAASGKPSPLGPHLIMGSSAKQKFINIRANLEAGRIAPVLIMATRL
jgi:ubiquinone/menaquinone biosynthesis C-methylase UbiE